MKAKRKIKINKAKLIVRLTVLVAIVVLVSTLISGVVSFAKYPEEYLSTWKYQLENDLANGDEEALEYYNRVYVSNGKYLFGDEYIVAENPKREYLNLASVIGYDVTDDGLKLYTDSGNEYTIEK